MGFAFPTRPGSKILARCGLEIKRSGRLWASPLIRPSAAFLPDRATIGPRRGTGSRADPAPRETLASAARKSRDLIVQRLTRRYPWRWAVFRHSRRSRDDQVPDLQGHPG